MKTKITKWGQLTSGDVCLDTYDGSLCEVISVEIMPEGGSITWHRITVNRCNNVEGIESQYLVDHINESFHMGEVAIMRESNDFVIQIIR